MRDSVIRPQSIDAGKEKPRGHALVASAFAPGTVTPNGMLEAPGAMAMDEAEEKGDEEQDARIPKKRR